MCLEVTCTVLYTLLTLLLQKEGEENSVSDLLIIFYNIPGLIYKHFRSIVGQHQEGVWDKITFQLPYSVLKRQLALTFTANKARQFKSSSHTYHMV